MSKQLSFGSIYEAKIYVPSEKSAREREREREIFRRKRINDREYLVRILGVGSAAVAATDIHRRKYLTESRFFLHTDTSLFALERVTSLD